MRLKLTKKKELTDEQLDVIKTKQYFDRIVPGVIRFFPDHYICGNSYKSCWAVTEYPPVHGRNGNTGSPCGQKWGNA